MGAPVSGYACPSCGLRSNPRNPIPTVDIIIELGERIVLIRRRNTPLGWALPGGFVDYGETLEEAAKREAREETSLSIRLIHLFGVYSDPDRDPRGHSITTVFVAEGKGTPGAADDAESLRLFDRSNLPDFLAFDHADILQDYFAWKHRKPRIRFRDFIGNR